MQTVFSGSLHAYWSLCKTGLNLGSLPVVVGLVLIWADFYGNLTLFSCQRNKPSEPFLFRLLYVALLPVGVFVCRSYAGRNWPLVWLLMSGVGTLMLLGVVDAMNAKVSQFSSWPSRSSLCPKFWLAPIDGVFSYCYLHPLKWYARLCSTIGWFIGASVSPAFANFSIGFYWFNQLTLRSSMVDFGSNWWYAGAVMGAREFYGIPFPERLHAGDGQAYSSETKHASKTLCR